MGTIMAVHSTIIANVTCYNCAIKGHFGKQVSERSFSLLKMWQERTYVQVLQNTVKKRLGGHTVGGAM